MSESAGPSWRWCLAVIAAAELATRGVIGLFYETGFYLYDWPLLEAVLSPLSGAAARAADFGVQTFYDRPMYFLFYIPFVRMAGTDPGYYRVLILLLKIAESAALFLFLDRFFGRRRFALVAAVLAVLYPVRSATGYMISNFSQTLGLALGLLALYWALDWFENPSRKRFLASSACYFACLLTYESGFFFLPFFLGAGIAARAYRSGRGLREIAVMTATAWAPLAPGSLLFGVWRTFGLNWLSVRGVPPVQFSPSFFFQTFKEGANVLTYGPVHDAWITAGLVVQDLPFGFGVFWVAAVFAVLLFIPVPGREDGGKDDFLRPAAAAAVAGFVGAYLPYALSGQYVPVTYGHMSRLNGPGALAGAVFLAVLLTALARWRPKGSPGLGGILSRGLLASSVGAFLWTNWFVHTEWSRSWTAQQEVLRNIGPKAKLLPKRSTVILRGAPKYTGAAPVFLEGFDFSPALRLHTGRGDIMADVFTNRIKFEKGRVVGSANPRTGSIYPYENLFLYDYPENKLLRLLP